MAPTCCMYAEQTLRAFQTSARNLRQESYFHPPKECAKAVVPEFAGSPFEGFLSTTALPVRLNTLRGHELNRFPRALSQWLQCTSQPISLTTACRPPASAVTSPICVP